MNETRLKHIVRLINLDDNYMAECGDGHYLIRVWGCLPTRFPEWDTGDDLVNGDCWTETPIVLMYDLGVTCEPPRAYSTSRYLVLDAESHDDEVFVNVLKAIVAKLYYGELRLWTTAIRTHPAVLSPNAEPEQEDDEYQYLVDEAVSSLKPKMGTMDKIFAYENGELTEDEVIDLFQELVDSKMAWTLQGHYGRTATAMIDRGLIKPSNSKYT